MATKVPKTCLLHAVLPLASIVATGLPPTPHDVNVLDSLTHPGVKISYKEPDICETAARSYSGYISSPPRTVNDTAGNPQQFPTNTFFWFSEARSDPHNAPLSIWLNGGPGGSSMAGALIENGPCFIGNDSNSTYHNPWSWNNEVNMLYIDQPVHTGFSYDVTTNITASFDGDSGLGWHLSRANFSGGVPDTNSTFHVGKSGSLRALSTADDSEDSAIALWHFAQTWFTEFPHYRPNDNRISLFTESYGGHYGPAMMRHFIRQNERITSGFLNGSGTHILHIDTLGIINGCIDTFDLYQSYVDFAVNNTYGIKVFSDTEYAAVNHALRRPDGTLSKIEVCREYCKV